MRLTFDLFVLRCIEARYSSPYQADPLLRLIEYYKDRLFIAISSLPDVYKDLVWVGIRVITKNLTSV